MRRLIHYGSKPLTEVYSVPIETQRAYHGGLHKPRGLWVSVEGEQDWKEWCEGEQWGLDGLAHATEVILAPRANVLRVEGEAALDRFHEEYSVVAYRYGGALGVRTAISWPAVAEKYDGVIIAPYVFSRRLDMSNRLDGSVSDWYYGWDCASGCIWNAAAVSELRALQQQEAA